LLQHKLPSRQHEIEVITDDYVRQLFSPTQASFTESPTAASSTLVYEGDLAWRRLYPEMVKAIFKRHLPKWLRINR
jgi:hypothetical protein